MASHFDGTYEFPDPDWLQRYHTLEGLDDVKAALLAEAELALDPHEFTKWTKKLRLGGGAVRALIEDRPHMVILHGDVGTGKTALAESVGAAACHSLGKPFVLKRLSLSVRGTGHVGEMTARITAAFQEVVGEARPYKRPKGATKGIILVIDEADSIAQSRDGEMHHEDRAGVNALLRGLDDIAREGLPVLTILCTNRRNALDPAVLRRANLEWEFHRPDQLQVTNVIRPVAAELGISESEIHNWATQLVSLDDAGATYSDLRKRILPAVVLDAWRQGKTNSERVKELTSHLGASPRFQERIWPS